MDGLKLFSSANDCVYTNCYCEENVWHLCKSVKESHPDSLPKCFCVFISNQDKMIPLWEQKSSKSEDGIVIWDYHVIFIHQDENDSHVYDLDSRLEFPCQMPIYVERGIQSCLQLKPQYHRKFRVIQAEEFLKTFASDRSHMLDDDNKWLKTPPSYPCIKTEASTNNINDYISMEPSVGVGEVLNFLQFCDKFIPRSVT